MEKLSWKSEVSHKIALPEAFSRSPQCAVLISYFIKHWMFSKLEESPFDNLLIKLCEEKKKGDLNTLKTCFAMVEQMTFDDLMSNINTFCEYQTYFTQLGLFTKTMRSSAIINYLSKNLSIMIIQVERGSEAPKQYFSGFGQNPVVIHIVQDAFRYYPGIHLEEYQFIHNPDLSLLNSFPFVLTNDKKPKPKTLQDKITTIMKNIEKSLDHVHPEMGNVLLKFISQNPLPGIKDDDLNSFKNALKNCGKCNQHNLAVFNCDNVHCVDCAVGKTVCRCEKRFDQQEVRKRIIGNKIQTTLLVSTFQIAGLNAGGTANTKYNLPNKIDNPPNQFVQTDPTINNQYKPTYSMNPQINYGNNQPIPAQNMYAPNVTNQIRLNQGNAYNANPQVIPPTNKPPISVTQSAPSEQIYHIQGNAYNANPQVIPPTNEPPISSYHFNLYPQNFNDNKGYQQPDFSNQVYNPQNPYGYNFEEQAIPPMNNIPNTMIYQNEYAVDQNIVGGQNISNVYNCTGCQQQSYNVNLFCQNQNHLFCENCSNLSQAICPMCNGIACYYCGLYEFVSNLMNSDGYFYHPNCVNSSNQNS